MKKYILLIMILPLMSYSQDNSKLNSFSKEFTTYIDELQEIMFLSKNKEAKIVFKSFEDMIDSDVFLESHKEEIIKIYNLMLEKRLRVNSYFIQFLRSLSMLSQDPTKI